MIPAMANKPKTISKASNFFRKIKGSNTDDNNAVVDKQVKAMVTFAYLILA